MKDFCSREAREPRSDRARKRKSPTHWPTVWWISNHVQLSCKRRAAFFAVTISLNHFFHTSWYEKDKFTFRVVNSSSFSFLARWLPFSSRFFSRKLQQNCSASQRRIAASFLFLHTNRFSPAALFHVSSSQLLLGGEWSQLSVLACKSLLSRPSFSRMN